MDSPRVKRKAFDEAGHAHELTFSTYRRTHIFNEDWACETFLSHLDRARAQLSWEVWAYVLMPDHVHLLVWPKEPHYSVAEFLRAVKQPSSATVIGRLKFEKDPRILRLQPPSGGCRLWQAGGGYDRNIISPQATLKSIEYIHNNPVNAKLASRSVDYKWSSFSWYEGSRDVPLEVDTFAG